MLEKIEKFVKFLDENGISYCLIGGVAVLLYGGRASTIDLDLYVISKEFKKLKLTLKKYAIPFEEAGEFQIRVQFMGLKVDILWADQFAGLPCFKRAKIKKLGKISVKVASVEDLIILKTIANRSIDVRDIQELRELFKVDEKYIQRRLKIIQKAIDG